MSGQAAWRPAAGDARGRRPIEVVGAAGRLAQSRAAAADLRSVELRVFGAVVSLTVMWTKLDDEVYLTQVADLAGIGGSTKNKQREAGRALARLAELGIITYQPATGRGQRSQIGLPSLVVQKGGPGPTLSDDKTCEEPTERVGQDPPFPVKGWVNPARKGGRFGAKRVGDGVPPTERDPREVPKIPDATRAVTADELTLDLRAGVDDNPQGPQGDDVATELLVAVARAAPASARHELLDDPDQAPGRAALRRRLVALADEVGFDAAVVVVAGEWPTAVASPMAHANARARARLEGHPVSAPPATPAPTPAPAVVDQDAAAETLTVDEPRLARLAQARQALLDGAAGTEAP